MVGLAAGAPLDLPPPLHGTLSHYARHLVDGLGHGLVAIYLYGSAALGAFRPPSSDLDLLVLLHAPPDTETLSLLDALHRSLGDAIPHANLLDVSFVALHAVGQDSDGALPFFRGGRFIRAGGGDVNAVTWHTARTAGVALFGPPPATIIPPVRREALEACMRHNLDFLRECMPRYVLSGAEDVAFGVLSLCRVLYTLETGEIISKERAGRWAEERVDARWRPLIDWALRAYSAGPPYPGRIPGQEAVLFARALGRGAE